jgi:hypothetical protein
VKKNSSLPVFLVDFDGAIKFRQLLLKELQIGVDKAELQGHRFPQLLIGRSSAIKQKEARD